MALEARDLVKSPNKESGIAAVTVITMVITVTMWTQCCGENLSACKVRLFGRFEDQHTKGVPVRPAEREQKGSTHCR